MRAILLSVLIGVYVLNGQTTNVGNGVQFTTGVPEKVTQGTAAPVGTPGSTTYYYWVINKFPVGNTFPGGPFPVFNAPDVLSGSNYVKFTWNGFSGALGYDVIRTTVPFIPSSGICANCLVTSTTAPTTSINDQGGALTNYTVNTTSIANASILLNNRDYSTPRLVFNPDTVQSLRLGQLCFIDNTCQTTSTSGTVSSVFGRVGIVVANTGDYQFSQISGIALANQGGTGQSSYTKGDLLCASNATTLIKLAVGPDGQNLTADSSQPCGVKWLAGGTGTGTVQSIQLNPPTGFTLTGPNPCTTTCTWTLTTTGLADNLVYGTTGGTGVAGFISLPATAVPNLDASKVTTGVFNQARLPNPYVGNVTGNVSGTSSGFDHTPTSCTAPAFAFGINSVGAANCAVVQYSQVSGAPTSLPPNGSAGGDLGSSYPTPSVLKINGSALGATNPLSGNILIGDGTFWQTRAMSGDATLGPTGIINFASVNANIGTFGDATHVAQVTLNAKGQVTGAVNVLISGGGGGGSPTGPAGGDLNGNYPNPGVAKINGWSLGDTTANSGAMLIANGSYWINRIPSGDVTFSPFGVTTLANANGAPGTYGSSTTIPIVTVNAKGLATAVSSTPLTGTGAYQNCAAYGFAESASAATNSAALVSCLASCPTSTVVGPGRLLGCTMVLPAGKYSISSIFTIGNGTGGSGGTPSTVNNITVQGGGFAGAGIGRTAGTTLLWTGSSGSPMFRMQGPMAGVNIYGIVFDSNFTADRGIESIHCSSCTFKNLTFQGHMIDAFWTYGYTGHLPSGVQVCAGLEVWDTINTVSPGQASTNGFKVGGDTMDDNSPGSDCGYSRGTFRNFEIAPGASGIGLELRAADANLFDKVYFQGGTTMIRFNTPGGSSAYKTSFPQQNTWINMISGVYSTFFDTTNGPTAGTIAINRFVSWICEGCTTVSPNKSYIDGFTTQGYPVGSNVTNVFMSSALAAGFPVANNTNGLNNKGGSYIMSRQGVNVGAIASDFLRGVSIYATGGAPIEEWIFTTNGMLSPTTVYTAATLPTTTGEGTAIPPGTTVGCSDCTVGGATCAASGGTVGIMAQYWSSAWRCNR